MRLSIGRVEALHTLVVAVGALSLALLMALGAERLYQEQALVGDDAKYLSDMRRLEDSGRQLLVLGDLIYGSGVTYLIAGAESQIALAGEILNDIEESPLSASSDASIGVLRQIMQDNYERLQTAATINSQEEVAMASRLLGEWDEDASRAVEALTTLRENMDALAAARAANLDVQRQRLALFGALGAAGYALIVLAMWLWVRRLLVNPLRKLTVAAEQALRDDVALQIEEQGPFEVRQLTRSTRAFAGQLEARVEERTHALRMRETELVAEVAERQRAEQQAALALTRAEEASAAKSEFLANMSHEIRTPLNGILGGTELAMRLAQSDEQRTLLETVFGSGNHLLNVINDVLDFSKLDAGQLELESRPFSFLEVISSVTRLFAATAAEKKVEIVVDVPCDLPVTLLGDGQRIGQILSNLISNALKFTPAGEIVVRLELESMDVSAVGIRLSVADTGVGIPIEKQKQIFDPFRQADGSTTRKWGGTGLGLSICRQFVELMGGEIGVSSEPGQGAEFYCRFPLKLDPEKQAEMLAIDRDWPVRPAAHVAVANCALADVLRANLEHWGWQLVSPEKAYLLVLDQADHPAVSAPLIVQLKQINEPARNDAPSHWLTLNRPLLPSELYTVLDTKLRGVGGGSVADVGAQNDALARSVLVVEDNKTNQLIARKMLQTLGCDVTIADDGLAGVTAFRQGAFDVVLMDWHMPGMDGLEATREIRAWESQQNRTRTPIVALTANAMEGDADVCLEAGMDGYIAKPVSVTALQQLLENN